MRYNLYRGRRRYRPLQGVQGAHQRAARAASPARASKLKKTCAFPGLIVRPSRKASPTLRTQVDANQQTEGRLSAAVRHWPARPARSARRRQRSVPLEGRFDLGARRSRPSPTTASSPLRANWCSMSALDARSKRPRTKSSTPNNLSSTSSARITRSFEPRGFFVWSS